MSKVMRDIIKKQLEEDGQLLQMPNKNKLKSNAEVIIKIPADAMSKDDINKVFKAVSLLNEAGINFDCGFGCGYIDFVFDKHMKGANVIRYHRKKTRLANELLCVKHKIINLIKGRKKNDS